MSGDLAREPTGNGGEGLSKGDEEVSMIAGSRPNKRKRSEDEGPRGGWVRGRPYSEHLYYRRLTKKRLRRERAKLKSKVGR